MNFKQHSQISGGGVCKTFYLIHADTEYFLKWYLLGPKPKIGHITCDTETPINHSSSLVLVFLISKLILTISMSSDNTGKHLNSTSGVYCIAGTAATHHVHLLLQS